VLRESHSSPIDQLKSDEALTESPEDIADPPVKHLRHGQVRLTFLDANDADRTVTDYDHRQLLNLTVNP
jgi:hypothetical protein